MPVPQVYLELVRSKCLPILLYGLECYLIIKASVKSLDFVVICFLMKLFDSANMNINIDSVIVKSSCLVCFTP